jgi:phosphoserine phosphatase SerB
MQNSFVLNVIAQDGDAVAAKLAALGTPHWLSNGHAFDIGFDGDAQSILAAARTATEGLQADINVVATAGRRKKLLVSDMESTIISCECLDELAEIAGIKPKIADITERAMRGEIAFEGALRERVGLLKGLGLGALEQVYREKAKLIGGAMEFVATMKANGAHTMLVSGGFTYYTAKIAALTGFDEHQANTLNIDGEVLAGTVGEPILGREAKLEALERGLKQFGLDASQALAIGDGANDLAMIQKAGMGVAFHAKPVVAASAGFAITHGTLRDVLYLQGYSDAEIAG